MLLQTCGERAIVYASHLLPRGEETGIRTVQYDRSRRSASITANLD